MEHQFGLDVARRLSGASEGEWPVYFEELRSRRELHEAVRQINALLDCAEYRPIAVAALQRIGLWHAVSAR